MEADKAKSAVWVKTTVHIEVKKLLLEDFTPENKLEDLASNLMAEAIAARKLKQLAEQQP